MKKKNLNQLIKLHKNYLNIYITLRNQIYRFSDLKTLFSIYILILQLKKERPLTAEICLLIQTR